MSQAFKDVVEKFDPGVHQFVPFQIVIADGTPYSGKQFYFFFNRQVIDSVDPRGHREVREGLKGSKPYLDGIEPISVPIGVLYSCHKNKFGSAGIWREKRLGKRSVMSDAFIAALTDASVQGWETSHPFFEI